MDNGASTPRYKKDWPEFIAHQLGVPTVMGIEGPWTSTSGTTLKDWFIDVGEALSVPYLGSKTLAMQHLVEAVGMRWDAVSMASTDTASGGGGNLQARAFETLWEGIVSSPEGQAALSLAAGRLRASEVEDAFSAQIQDRLVQSILSRRGQPAFRARLLAAYDNRCAISGSDVAETLEAAHIAAHATGGSMDVRNGILLRSDLHTLFDLGLIAIDTTSWTVVVSPRIAGSGMAGDLIDRSFRLPVRKADHPSRVALDEHRRHFGL